MPNQEKTYKDFEKTNMEETWKCQNCGNVVTAIRAPETCPVCMHSQSYIRSNEITDWSGTLKKILIVANEKEMTLEEITRKAVDQRLLTADEAAQLLKTSKSVDDFGKKVFRDEEIQTRFSKGERINQTRRNEVSYNSKIANKEEFRKDQKTRDE